MAAKPIRKPRTPIVNNLFPDDSELSEPVTKVTTVKTTTAKTPPVKTIVKPVAAAPVAVTVRKARATDPMTVPTTSGQPGRPVVNLDKRKLNKAQQSRLLEWSGKQRDKTLDVYFQGQAEQALKKFGHGSVLVANDLSNLIIGIPTPALAFEYLICQDVFPLGLIMQLNGEPGTGKSSLLYEIFRWFGAAGGGAHLEEVEDKFNPELLDSIMNYGTFPVLIDKCSSVEDWQKHMLFWIKTWKDKLTGTQKDPGPGRTVPIAIGVDSIMGKLSDESQEKVIEAGAAGRNFPLEALSITGFMKTLPHQIRSWPFAIILNNHIKLRKDEDGREVRSAAGGRAVNFQESFELETIVAKRRITCVDWDGMVIRIKCVKNSFGPTWRQIETRMLWWDEINPAFPDAGDPRHWRQRTAWDWDWATVKMLTTLQGKDASRVKSVFHIDAPRSSDVENIAWSKTLGMSAKDAVSWSKLGAMIRERQDVTDVLRGALAIRRRPLLAGDYLQQQEKLRVLLP